MDPGARPARADQPRPRAPLAAAAAPALGTLPARPALRRHRRVPRLPRRLRLPPLGAAAPAAAGGRPLRLPADVRPRLRHRARPRRPRRAPDRAAGARGRARRLAPGGDDLRAVGARRAAGQRPGRRRGARTPPGRHRCAAARRARRPTCSRTSWQAGCRPWPSRGRAQGSRPWPRAPGAPSRRWRRSWKAPSRHTGAVICPRSAASLERSLRDGSIVGLAATNALELGIDISGLDAVLLAGWPGTRASLWQQAGRAGRAGTRSLALFVAADDPLDTYVVHHPEALFGQPVEATVMDPDNPHVLGAPPGGGGRRAAADARPTSPCSAPHARELVDALVARGILRRRPGGWYWARTDRATDHVSLRGVGRGRRHRRAAHRPGAGHDRRGLGALAGAHGGGPRAPGRDLRRHRARPRARHGDAWCGATRAGARSPSR